MSENFDVRVIKCLKKWVLFVISHSAINNEDIIAKYRDVQIFKSCKISILDMSRSCWIYKNIRTVYIMCM